MPKILLTWNSEKQYDFEAIHVIDHDLLYAASCSAKCIFETKLVKDGYGICGEVEIVRKYLDGRKNVVSMTVYQSSMFSCLTLNSVLCT